MMRLHKILLTLVCFTVLSAHAQWKWLNPLECGFPVIQNQGWTEEIGDRYVRLPQRAEARYVTRLGFIAQLRRVGDSFFQQRP